MSSSSSSSASSSSSSSANWPVASSVAEKEYLITRNLDEVMGGVSTLERIRSIICERDLQLYWGTATTGAPHVAYFVPMSKIADFLRAGCKVTILFADLHAFLDNQKAPWELLQFRTDYYEHVIKGMLESIGVPLDKLHFVRGTSYQLSREYTLDMYRLTSTTTERNAKKAGAEVVKQVESPLLSGLIYPLLQALDEEYLKVDAQFGGVDQRKIFTYAEENMPSLGYAKRIHLMNPMVPGLTGNKMSSSEANSKIDLLDPPEVVKSKINNAVAAEKEVEGNGVLAFAKMVLFSVHKVNVHSPKGQGYLIDWNEQNEVRCYVNGTIEKFLSKECKFEGGFLIERNPKYGENSLYYTYSQLEKDYKEGLVHPGDLKAAVTKSLNNLLAPIRQKFTSPEMQQLIANAYPETVKFDKKKGKKDEKEEKKDRVDTGKALSLLELRVAKIVQANQNAQISSAVDLKVEIGNGAHKIAVAPIAQDYQPIEQLIGKHVVVLVNVATQTIGGVVANALPLIFELGTRKELASAPANALIGERVRVPGLPLLEALDDNEQLKEAHYRNVGSTLAELSASNSDRSVRYHDKVLTTSQGPLTVSLLNSGGGRFIDSHHQLADIEAKDKEAKGKKQQQKGGKQQQTAESSN